MVRADADLNALRASIVRDLPLLLQHAAPDAFVAMHGLRCSGGALYRGAFWIGNVSVPCWQRRFRQYVNKGTLVDAKCRSLGFRNLTTSGRMLEEDGSDGGEAIDSGHEMRSGAVAGEYMLCTGILRGNASACAKEQPLLERWAGSGCAVRKEPVTMEGVSTAWTRSRWHGEGRQSLSHMFRRHMRYYSAVPCEGGQQVCMLFKNEIDEEWVAGVNSSDGLTFRGDPALILPKFGLRAELYETLRSLPSARTNLSSELGRRFEARMPTMTHNLALVFHKGRWLAVGGKHNAVPDILARTTSLTRKDKYHRWHSVRGWYNRTVARLRAEQPNWPHDGLGRRLAAQAPLSPRDVIEGAFGFFAWRLLEKLPERLNNISRRGLWMMESNSWRYDDSGAGWLDKEGNVDEPTRSSWRAKRLILDGTHPGCVERRNNKSIDTAHVIEGVCEFDGRLALVSFEGSLLLFTRSNPAAHGSRHVQVTKSADDGVTWSPFEQVKLDGYEGLGDIYFFGAQVNPAHDGSLLAVFPLVHRMRGCISMAASLDGVRWTRITPLLTCAIYGERSLDHPAAPAMVRRGGEVWLYVQEEVPGVTIDSTTPRLTYAHMVKHERPSGVVRYAFSCDKLAKWTEAALKEWKAAYGGASRTFLSTCGSDAETASAKAYSPRSAACQWNPRVHSTAHRHVPPVQPPARIPKPRKPSKKKGSSVGGKKPK